MSPMTHATSRPPKTIDDYLALPDEVRAELIGGEIYVTPPPFLDHQRVVRRLLTRIDAWVQACAAGEVFDSPVGVRLPSGAVVEPDLVFVTVANRGILRERMIEGVPDLMIEVVSPGHPERDRLVKRDLYEENGVPEFWLVDPPAGGIEVFRLEDSEYRPAGWFTRGSVLETLMLPGFRLSVDEILA